MSDLYPKFIIEDDNLILSKVTYHKELVTDKNKVKGGGWFMYNKDENTITFNGSSHDFGPAAFEDIKKCVEDGKVYSNKSMTHSIADKHKFFYSTGTEKIILNP